MLSTKNNILTAEGCIVLTNGFSITIVYQSEVIT